MVITIVITMFFSECRTQASRASSELHTYEICTYTCTGRTLALFHLL